MISKKKTAKKKTKKKSSKTRRRSAARKPAARKASKKKRPVTRQPVAKKEAPPKSNGKANNVVAIHRYTELSISQLSLDTGFTRETVGKRIADLDVQPARKIRGYPVYRLKDVLPALFQATDGELDPDKLKPFERKAYYECELDKLKLELERGELVPTFEVERKMARLFKMLTQYLDTLPDILERDIGISVDQLVRIEKQLYGIREAMYLEVIEDDGSEHDARRTAKKRG